MSHWQERGDNEVDFSAASFYAAALGPIGTARMLPPAVFRSLAFSQFEDLAVWTRHWICVGVHEDVAALNDLLPFTIGTHGIHVQRVASGLLARFNKAQHGGCRLVPVQCRTGTKTPCSFTSCGYSRDRGPILAGELGDGTPQMHQYLGLRPERLLTAVVDSKGPLIFVNLDTAPAELAASLSALDRSFPLFTDDGHARLATLWAEHKANWKLLALELLGDVSPGSEEARSDSCFVARANEFGGDGLKVAWLFPNLVLLADAHETCAVVLQPTAIGQTLCRVSLYGSAGGTEGAAARWRDRLASLARAAEANHEMVARWGTASLPETIGLELPLQTRPQGLWMQDLLSRKALSVGAAAVDLQRYEMSRM